MASFSSDPISAISDAVTALSVMVGKAIPSDEERMARLKLRSPLIYARIRKRLYNMCRRELKHRWHQDIDSTVNYYLGALAKDEIEYAKKMLHSELSR